MGLRSSKPANQSLKLDNISTVSMAFTDHSNKCTKSESTRNQTLLDSAVVNMTNGVKCYQCSPTTNKGPDPNNNNIGRGSKLSKSEQDGASSIHSVTMPASDMTTSNNHFALEQRPSNSLSHNSDLFTSSHQEGREAKKDDRKQTAKNRNERKSFSPVLIFLFELCLLAIVFVLAIFLRFSDTFDVVERSVFCNDSSIRQIKDPSIKSSVIFGDISDNDFMFYLLVLFAPLVLIVLGECFRQLILVAFQRNTGEVIVLPKIRLRLSLLPRRLVRFIGGFFFGFLATSILVDVLKLQTGEIRPDFLNICKSITDYCRNHTNSEVKMSDISCTESDIRDGRMSFPSIHASLSTYSALFLIFYFTIALNYRGLRLLRSIGAIVLSIISLLLSLSTYTVNRNYWWDILAGMIIGALISLYVIFWHLNCFANKLSTTNPFSAKRSNIGDESNSNKSDDDEGKEWFRRSFHIPRVQTLRQSMRNMWSGRSNLGRVHSNLDKRSNQASRINVATNNAYINPAFEGRDDQILDNHIHYEYKMRDTNNNHQQRHQLRTFQSNA